MTLTEKVAYLKGLAEGLDLKKDDKETKIFEAIFDILEDLALTVTDIDEDLSAVEEFVDAIDEDLDELEEFVYCDDDDDFCCCDDADDDGNCGGDGEDGGGFDGLFDLGLVHADLLAALESLQQEVNGLTHDHGHQNANQQKQNRMVGSKCHGNTSKILNKAIIACRILEYKSRRKISPPIQRKLLAI